MRRLRRLIAFSCLPLALFLLLPLSSSGSPASRLEGLKSQIGHARGKLEHKRGHARVLSSDITRWNRRISRIQSHITELESEQDRIQLDLDAKRADLLRTRGQLRRERAKLQRLKTRLAHARVVLRRRLVSLYESDPPDLVTIVLNSDGFADLLEQADFLRRIGMRDRGIMDAVRVAKEESVKVADRLDRLEGHQEKVADRVLARRNQVAEVHGRLAHTRGRYREVRATRHRALSHVNAQATDIKGHLAQLQQASRRVEAELRARQSRQAPSGGSAPAGPLPPSAAGLIWPVQGPITSPFCESRSWESCHPGIDIGVGTGTPIHAAAAGTVVLQQPTASSGGYGNFTCIQHTASMSTCYAHQERFAVGPGQHVKQGQVIGYSDCTGLCFGPHLHFEVRIDGAVVNPLSYLP